VLTHATTHSRDVGCNLNRTEQMKDYRVLNIFDSEIEITNQHVAIIELVEVEYQDFLLSDLDYRPYTFGSEGEKFVFDFNSNLTKEIIRRAEQEQIVKLDMTEFNFRHELKNGKMEKFGYHDSVKLIGLDEQDELITSQKLENIIQECVLYHHTDMFFNFVFRFIIDTELPNNQDISDISQLKPVFKTYQKLCQYILLESAKVLTLDCDELTQTEKNYFEEKYFQLVKHAKDYCDVINTYVIYLDKKIIEFIEWELKDKSPFFFQFQQSCLLKGYEIARNRIEKNLENQNFFNHEIINTENQNVLKFFPTPYGMGKKWYLVESVKNSTIIQVIDEYLNQNGFKLITGQDINKELKTSIVFESIENKESYYFKKREIDGSYVAFAEQDRKNPLRAILVQGQLNLTKIIS